MVPMDIINIYDNYNSFFDSKTKSVFEELSNFAEKTNYKIYLIGGLVRDMLLNQPSLDIDITVVGNAIELAKKLEKNKIAKIISIHKSFGTVKIKIKNKNIDLASTRNEAYPLEGHLPVIKETGCDLKDDVTRRDFTINAIAMSLNKNNFANLIDYTNGLDDLKSKNIRILHDKSFIDDPTRIIRALKYSSRLNFDIEPKTFSLMKAYLNNINYDMCYKRIKQEFKKTFKTLNQEVFDKFIELDIYKLITKQNINIPTFNPEKLCQEYNPKHAWFIYFAYLIINDTPQNFELTKYEKEVITGAKSLLQKTLTNNIEIYKAFCAQKIETLILLALCGKPKEVNGFLNNLKSLKLEISGKDLIKLGFAPSKDFAKVLDYVLEAKIKNPNLTKSDETKLAKKYFEELTKS